MEGGKENVSGVLEKWQAEQAISNDTAAPGKGWCSNSMPTLKKNLTKSHKRNHLIPAMGMWQFIMEYGDTAHQFNTEEF